LEVLETKSSFLARGRESIVEATSSMSRGHPLLLRGTPFFVRRTAAMEEKTSSRERGDVVVVTRNRVFVSR